MAFPPVRSNKTFAFIDARTLCTQAAAQFDSSQAAVKEKSRSSCKCPKLVVGPADMTEMPKRRAYSPSREKERGRSVKEVTL